MELQKTQELRGLIDRMQHAIEDTPGSLGEDPFPLRHQFADGVYLRTILLPKGYFIVGKIHKTRHAVFLMEGDVSILTDQGVTRVKAPANFISEPGTKRVVYAHENSSWTNVHATTETDIDKIEEQVIAKNYEELEFLP